MASKRKSTPQKPELKRQRSVGGPLIVLAKGTAPSWEGTDPPSGKRVVKATFRWDPDVGPTDYDRACDVDGMEVVPVGKGEAIIFNDEPSDTIWWPSGGGGILVRLVSAPQSDERIVTFLNSCTEMGGLPKPSKKVRFTVGSDSLVAFDAASPGEHALDGEDHFLEFSLPAGSYEVNTVVPPYQEFKRGTLDLVLHFFRKLK